ncbi:MAG: GIN domain-containing protein [Muribaculaceae bacterium]
MKRIFLATVIALATCTVAFAQTQRYEKNLGQYNSIRVLNHLTVDIVCNPDSAGKAVFFATDKAVPRIIFSNNSKGKLTIQTDNTVDEIQLPKVKVFVGELAQVENAADSTVTVNVNHHKVNQFKAKTSGNGKLVVNDVEAVDAEASISTGHGRIYINGNCQELNISNVGTGEVHAYDMQATNVKCRIVGTGQISCRVNGGTLNLRGSGTGKLYYKGNPSDVSVKKLGSLKAIKVDED